jgi:hypothetical protein
MATGTRDGSPAQAQPESAPARDEPGSSPAAAAAPAPVVRPSAKPALTHLEQPHPVLQAAGFSGGIQQFNEKIQQVVDAHRHAYGTDPSPGLALDVAKSSADPAHLFTVPLSPHVARAQNAVSRAHAQGFLASQDEENRVLDGVGGAIRSGQLQQFVRDNADTIDVILADPDRHKQFVAAVTRGQSQPATGRALIPGMVAAIKGNTFDQWSQENSGAVKEAWADTKTREQLVKAADKAGLTKPAQVLAQSFLVNPNSTLNKAISMGGNAFQQVALGLTLGPPILAYMEGKSVVQSAKQQSLHPFIATNGRLAHDVAKGVKRDVSDPANNAGNLFLDILGLASVGFGAGARVAAAGRAEGLAATARAISTRPNTGTFHLGEGADQPLSGNPLVARIQQMVNQRRTSGLTLNEDSPIPTGAAASLLRDKSEQIADGLLDPMRKNFSMENRIGRQLRAAGRVDRAMRLSIAEPLARAAGSAKDTSLVVSRLTPKGWRGLTAGEQKAIQVLSTDDPTPLATWRTFHENAIKQGIGDEAAHRAHLAALEQAQKVIENPSPKFLHALEVTREVMDEQTRLRVEKLGLTPEAAEGRIASLGQVVRGDVRNPSKNAIAPALTGSDEILRLSALGNTPEQIARHLVNPGPEFASDMGRTRYSSLDEALRAVKDRLASPEAKKALTPAPVRSKPISGRAFYLLYQSLAKAPRRKMTTFFGPRAGGFGIAHPESMPELTHYFSGDIIRAGDFRIDATQIASETYRRTVGLATKLDAWKRLHDHYATDEPRTPNDIPIRDERAVHVELRRLIAKAESGHVLTAEDVDGLPASMADDLTRYLLPHPDDAVPADGKWKWVDPRYLATEPRSALPTPLVRFFSNVNEPLRDAMIFVRPAYALNVLNNAQMLAIDQGILAVPNFVRALKAKEFYGAKAARQLDAMAGEGRMLSYAPNVGFATRISHGMASQWNRFTDLYFRRAAAVFYLRKLGYRTHEQIRQVLEDSLHDDKAMAAVTEASQRAKKSMVELDNMTPFEKNVLRHVVFVWPWQSRSALWSLRTLAEHPAQSAIYAEIGKSEHDELDPILKHLPAWMRDLGYMPTGFEKDGMPKVINPGTTNTFATLGEMAGLMSGDQTFTDLLGPGAELGLRLALERDRFGRTYQHPYLDPIVETLTGLPQSAALKRAGQKEPTTKALDITNPAALVGREHADVHRPIFVPGGFWNTYGPLILGGLDPRTVDPRAVEARFWRDQPWEVRHTHEAKLVQTWATAQGKFIAKQVPQDVRDALTLTSDRTAAYHSFSQVHGRTPTMHDRTALDIETLHTQGRITDAQAGTLRGNLKKVAPDELDLFRQGVLSKFAGGKALSDWQRQVGLVANISTRPNFDADIQKLVGLGVLPGKFKNAADAPHDALVEYGRQYLAFDAKIRDFARQAKEARAKGESTAPIEAALRLFQDQHDQPVSIGPSGKPLYAVGKPAGLVKAGNIDVNHRPVAQNADGSISTVRSISIGVGGKEVLIPTVVNGKVVSNQEAIAHYKATGENLGTFASVAAANKYAESLHNEQAGSYHTFPPLPRVAVARLTSEQLAAHLADNYSRNLATLSALDKSLMGLKSSPKITDAWEEQRQVIAAWRKNDPSIRIDKDAVFYAAKYVDKTMGLGGKFFSEVRLSYEPRWRQYTYEHIYQDSTNKPAWDEVFAVAKTESDYLATPDYDHAAIHQQWKAYARETLPAALQKEHPALWHELQPYLKADPSFLVNLISH